MNFVDKVVLVTGASSGIGEDAAIAFAKQGAKLALVGRNESRLNSVAEKIRNNGSPSPLTIIADVSKDATQIINSTIQHFGRLDILVNNAGIVNNNTASTMDFELYNSVFATDCRAPVELTKLAIPYLEKTKGNVVNVSSIGAFVANKEATAYCMAKAALDVYTKCASLELAPKGIRVNSVNPGLILTPAFQLPGSEEFMEKMKKLEIPKYPVGRFGEVSDTTNAILHLANENSSFENGVVLVVDCGRQYM